MLPFRAMKRGILLLLCSACVLACRKTDAPESVPKVAEPASKESPAAPPEGDDMQGIRVGDTAPDFEAKDEAGNTVHLSQHRGKQPVLLAFYPKDFTGG